MAEINDVLEIVQFLKDNSVSKNEAVTQQTLQIELAKMGITFDTKIDSVRDELRNDMKEMKSELIGHIDSFTKLYEKLDHELVALRDKYDQHEELFQKLFKRLQLDPKEL